MAYLHLQVRTLMLTSRMELRFISSISMLHGKTEMVQVLVILSNTINDKTV